MKSFLYFLLSILIASGISYIGNAIYSSNWNAFMWEYDVKQSFFAIAFFGSFIFYNIFAEDED